MWRPKPGCGGWIVSTRVPERGFIPPTNAIWMNHHSTTEGLSEYHPNPLMSQITVTLPESLRQAAVDGHKEILEQHSTFKESDETTFKDIVKTRHIEIPGFKFKGIRGELLVNAPFAKVAASFMKMRADVTEKSPEILTADTIFSKYYFFTKEDEAEF